MTTDSVHTVQNSVVSVWCKEQNKEKFIGSAFFISSSLLLTARHVVKDTTKNKLFASLFLRLVDGQNTVELNADHIYCHPELDVALIFLDFPYNSQALCCLSLQRDDYQLKQVDCFGIHRENYNRDANLGYTVGSSESDFSGYLIDHQVKKGFSGGPVAFPDNQQVIGIFSRRDTVNQETLFIPLYQPKCICWLTIINAQIKDPILADYLKPASKTENDTELANLFAKSLQELMIFIDRPATAYQHVIEQLVNSDAVIKTCLCLYSTQEDHPAEFAKALAFKLNKTETPNKAWMEDVEKDRFDAERVPLKAWQANTYEQFYQHCLNEIVESLDNNNSAPHISQDNPEVLEQQLIQLLRDRRMPKVLMLTCQLQNNTGLRFFARSRSKKLLRQRYQWIKKLNQQCNKLFASESLQPVAFLFFVRAEKALCLKSGKCFSLTTIDQNAFNNWLVFVADVLKFSGGYRQSQIFTFQNQYETQLVNQLQENKLKFPLSYQQFCKQTKTITNLNNSDHEQ